MFSGSGPGAQTDDGCSVELYAHMPYQGELDDVRALLAPGSSVLELGAGAGRQTRKLIEWGLAVTAVDSSAAMLVHVPPEARSILSTIEDLTLARTFDSVLLASGLINHPSAASRAAFVASARAHLHPGGQLFVEHDAGRLRDLQAGESAAGGGVRVACEQRREHPSHIDMTLRYEMAGACWRHSFRVAPLAEAEIETLLIAGGFSSCEWLGSHRQWSRAIAIPDRVSPSPASG